MEKSEEFRSVWFGGYNKDDVDEYLQTLRDRIEEAKVSYQRENARNIQKLKECEEYKREQEKQISMLQKELAQARIEAQTSIQVAERVEAELAEKTEELLKKDELLKREMEKNARLEAELKRHDEQREKVLLDYELMQRVLEDASKDADMMKAEAREEGRKIVAAAIVEAETKKNVIARRIGFELEEKALQLVAAKHKITQYMKDVNDTQQGLFEIYNKMHRMIENMPIRLEEFWDGEEYKVLEDKYDGEK